LDDQKEWIEQGRMKMKPQALVIASTRGREWDGATHSWVHCERTKRSVIDDLPIEGISA
jgi:hypothetical protein